MIFQTSSFLKKATIFIHRKRVVKTNTLPMFAVAILKALISKLF